jgi:hypothetical protein
MFEGGKGGGKFKTPGKHYDPKNVVENTQVVEQRNISNTDPKITKITNNQKVIQNNTTEDNSNTLNNQTPENIMNLEEEELTLHNNKYTKYFTRNIIIPFNNFDNNLVINYLFGFHKSQQISRESIETFQLNSENNINSFI